jgi:hypothetical protein
VAILPMRRAGLPEIAVKSCLRRLKAPAIPPTTTPSRVHDVDGRSVHRVAVPTPAFGRERDVSQPALPDRERDRRERSHVAGSASTDVSSAPAASDTISAPPTSPKLSGARSAPKGTFTEGSAATLPTEPPGVKKSSSR